MRLEKFLLTESARRDAYRALADCYYLPKEELNLSLKGLARQLETLGSDARSHILLMHGDIQAIKGTKKLQIDYARLFVGPYSLLAPPYGSVYLEGKRQIMGDSTMDIRKRYAEAGLTVTETDKEVPDHIRVELEFMYFLIFKEIEAIEAESAENVLNFLNRQKAFLQDHLGLWVSDLARKIEAHAETDFYRHLGLATRIFIDEDCRAIKDLEIPEPAGMENRASTNDMSN